MVGFQKVSLGCTTEFSESSGAPISRHCICDSHLCNYFSALSDENGADPDSALRQVVLDKSLDHDLVNVANELAGPILRSVAAETRPGVLMAALAGLLLLHLLRTRWL